MPFVVRQAVTPPPPPPVTPGTGQPKLVSWTGPNGDTILLTRANGYRDLTGRKGFGAVDADIVADRLPSGAALVRTHRVQPRLMTVPLLIDGATAEEYRGRLDRLYASTRHPVDVATGLPKAGMITVATPDGTSRSIDAYYQGGLEPGEDDLDDLLAARSFIPDLQFYAASPLWRGAPIERVWQVVVEDRPFYPIYPMRFTASQVLANATITNNGDSDAFPVWTIRGPGTPTATRPDTGESWAFTEAIPTGVTVTVDCRPVDLAPATGLTVMDDQDAGDESDWWDRLADFPDFWTLPPGVATPLELSMSGADETSLIKLSAVTQWQGAW